VISDNIRYDEPFSPYSSFSNSEKDGLYKAIFSRRDVRSHFITDKTVPRDVVLRILNAAHHAPSVGFSQPWNFILIKDKSLRRQVKESFLKNIESPSHYWKKTMITNKGRRSICR
jgi:nitroreductase